MGMVFGVLWFASWLWHRYSPNGFNYFIRVPFAIFAIGFSVQDLARGEEVVYLGEFSVRAYCPCEKCCGHTHGITKSGRRASIGTIAVDPRVIPLGRSLMIEGRHYRAEDTGKKIKGHKLDVFFPTHEAALQWGKRNLDVYLVKGE